MYNTKYINTSREKFFISATLYRIANFTNKDFFISIYNNYSFDHVNQLSL